MGSLFEKKGPHIQKSPYEETLKDLANEIMAKGRSYADVMAGFLPELTARPDRRYLTRATGEFEPILKSYLQTATSPLDDVLANYGREKYRRGVGDRLSALGLLGQGRGAELEANAFRDFEMDLLNRADARRGAATSAARMLEDYLRELDLGGRERTLSDIQNLGQGEIGFRSVAVPQFQNLYSADATKKGWEAAAKMASLSPYEEFLKNVNNTATTAGNVMSLFYGGVGGGKPMQTDQAAASPGPYAGTTPWGTPVADYRGTWVNPSMDSGYFSRNYRVGG